MATHRLTRAQRRERGRLQRERAANRRIGHDFAYVIHFGPYIAVVGAGLAALAGLWLVWVRVDRGLLAALSGAAALVVAAGWLLYGRRSKALQARLVARAHGRRDYTGVAVAGVVLALAGASAAAFMSRGAL
jgi:hypothetical protein